MRFVDIIEKKRWGQTLSEEEIQWWIEHYVSGEIPEYQVSALLMAIVLNGMDREETVALTKAMLYSGAVMDLSKIEGIKVDKHSTGGVGDKTTLVLAPMLAACGLKVAKMSGRGLGLTGGTLDKLDAIDGFDHALDQKTFVDQVGKIGVAIIGQTQTLVPADKKLYALRDVTGTVASIPLIASSIMSKKLAAGADMIELDVKFGNGAFMQTPEEAEALAKLMIYIGESFGKKISVMITDMNEPLGKAIGNELEVIEAVETLLGHGPEDFLELLYVGGARILTETGIVDTDEAGRRYLHEILSSGKAYEKFLEMVRMQGGDVSVIKDLDKLNRATYCTDVTAQKDGYIHQARAMELGKLAMELGAGRATMEDALEPGTGVVVEKKTGDLVKKGDILVRLYHNRERKEEWIEKALGAFEIKEDFAEKKQVIYKML